MLATAKVTIQGRFAKTRIQTTYDAVLFNSLIFLCATFLFFKDLLALTLPVILFASMFGMLTVLFQVCYIKAMSFGNVSLTVLLVNLSMIFPIIISAILYKEPLSLLRIIGIILTVVALVLNVDSKSEKSNFKKWFYLSLSASLCNGGLAICQKVFSKSQWNTQVKPFVACGYAIAAIIALILCFFLKPKNKTHRLKINFKTIIFTVSIGLLLGIFQVLNTKAISMIDGTLFFPAYYSGALILSYLSGLLILKERIQPKQLLSLSIGIIAIVLMNL